MTKPAKKCSLKRYKTADSARAGLRYVAGNAGRNMAVLACQHCNGYHIVREGAR